ncbi:MAG: class I SAM-dependent methyltransferase [Methanogenium sp.]|jgi:SAM-dependent methyltransferase
MIPIVNYNELWRLLQQRQGGRSKDWDKRAASFHQATSRSSAEIEEQIDALNLLPTDTVLDMGAGTGRFAVPMARRVSHVTALDPSTGMLAYLEEGMAQAGLSNYSVVLKRWEDVVVGQDIPVHDVVFASNSLGFEDLATELEKINAAARRAVHILWFAGETRHPMDAELLCRLGRDREARFSPDYLYIVNILHAMGIYADVSIKKVLSRRIYDTVDDAVVWMLERDDFSSEEVVILRTYLAETMEPMDDGRFADYRTGWRAHIWWEKEDVDG